MSCFHNPRDPFSKAIPSAEPSFLTTSASNGCGDFLHGAPQGEEAAPRAVRKYGKFLRDSGAIFEPDRIQWRVRRFPAVRRWRVGGFSN